MLFAFFIFHVGLWLINVHLTTRLVFFLLRIWCLCRILLVLLLLGGAFAPQLLQESPAPRTARLRRDARGRRG